MNRRQSLGKWGEEAACRYLLARGYRLLGQNVRTPYGEIDLIVQREDDPSLVIFVEVKTRASAFLGWPEESVTPKKARHLLDAASYYAGEHGIESWQIDVISIVGTPAKGYRLRHFEAAIDRC
uniref:UPF0102 protein HGMM_F19G07C20 n=1 Tax=uncultured Chloroflexota bacterium TaxID=166587 RepID=H5SF33_9CHLR|nr:hypothetical conserved protein [uncultured Chloroflexota bacterium]